ncbi:NUDIX domain-containing protein [Thalassoroseus pseudoceratinae]|uniref:NUDIX domain-containing protein n=1 Tax=Thalassoroseus pseudoceratinae TaxID=2713176 RepID=UPI0014247C4E|nr:NUDIX domain-containing protein [Thalassoroseus pseudoceratinae]
MDTPNARLRIGIAIVERAERFVIGVRSLHGSQPGKSEFPGGKCDPGESPVDCVVRECEEETGLTVHPFEEISIVTTERLELHFWRCRVGDEFAQTEPPLTSPFRWVPRHELAELDFPDANASIVRRLVFGSRIEPDSP